MRRSATKRRLTTRQREPVDRSANYLLKYQDYLAYDQYLATGLPIGYAGASLTDAGAHSLSLGGRLELGPAFDLTLEAERSDSANPDTEPVHDVTLEGSIRW